MRYNGVKSLAVLREPSLGPVFGIKGGAVGALKSTIVPSDDINLHFTGDFHALTSTINLIAAIIENHIFQGNELKINPKRIVWPRALDMNDRSLRSITVNACGTGGDACGSYFTPEENQKFHKSEFVITVASELMAIFCIATDEEDFLNRVDDIIVAYTYDEQPIRVKDFTIRGAIKKLMHTALSPNLVQTLEENPVLVHGGPFANIAHGCNSVIATKLGLKLADVVITEAGFGADLGAEKFLDIKCQRAGLTPDAVVLVATIRALKSHGGVAFEELDNENTDAMRVGFANLFRHYENLLKYSIPVVVAINQFPSDTDKEIELLGKLLSEANIDWSLNKAALEGGAGASELAKKVMNILETIPSGFIPLYTYDNPIQEKIEIICKEIYRAKDVVYTDKALQQIKLYTDMGYDKLAICMAKTPASFTDNAKILNAPDDFTITVREVRLSAGAGFIVALTGNVMTMPGLSKRPRAMDM